MFFEAVTNYFITLILLSPYDRVKYDSAKGDSV